MDDEVERPAEEAGGATSVSDSTGPRHAMARDEDDWLVGVFQGVFDWDRMPGDRLTFVQRLNIIGATCTALLVIAAGVFALIYFVLNVEDFVVTPTTPGQPR